MIEISKQNFFNRLKDLSKDYEIYIPIVNDDQKKEMVLLDDNTDVSSVELDGIRPSTNLKSLFFNSHSKVASWPGEDELNTDKKIIVGVKSCDIFNFGILDKIFMDKEYPEFTDLFYKTFRENTFIISSDCSKVSSSCSCKMFDIKPHSHQDKNVVMNLTQIDDNLIIEFYSDEIKKEIFEKDKTESSEKDLNNKRKSLRVEVEKTVDENLKQFKVPTKDYQKILKEKQNDKKWFDVVKDCVECHGCLNGCPTCHCYLLLDAEPDRDKFERYRVWDSCFYRNYAVMAGGSTPRPDFLKRFKNRFNHKYDFFVTNLNVMACSGCGRCIETCMGKIDFREVFDKINE